MSSKTSIALPITAAFLFCGLAISVNAAPPTTPPAAPVQVMNVPLPVTITDSTIGVEGDVTVDGAVTIDNTSPIPVAVESVEQHYTINDYCDLSIYGNPPTGDLNCSPEFYLPTDTRFVIEYVNARLYSSVAAFSYVIINCEFGELIDYFMPIMEADSLEGELSIVSENVTIYCDSNSPVTVNAGRSGVPTDTGGSASFSVSGRLIPNPD